MHSVYFTMKLRSAGVIIFLFCFSIPPTIFAGSCNGNGVFEGMGNFNGEGVFESEAGTFEGTGIFIGNNGSSFEGSGTCEFNARVQSVDEAQMVVSGDGIFTGRGRFEFEGGSFEGDGVMEGNGITFTGVGRFDGEGMMEESGRVNVFGESFDCTGSGTLAGDGTFEGEGSMRATGTFTGEGSMNGSGSLLGRGSCSGNNVEFQALDDGPVSEPTEEADEAIIESDIP